jgi:hypothetical protein
MRRLLMVLPLLLGLTLGGCVAYPAGPGYYGPRYAGGVYVAPRPYYRPYGYGYGGRAYGYGYGRYGYGYGYGRRW